MKRFTLFVATWAALTGCTNFDQLGEQARCALTQCDGGTNGADGGLDAGLLDAGFEDAGLDAGFDGGELDAGVDAGPGPLDGGAFEVVLVPGWATSEPFPSSQLTNRRGALALSAVPGYVVHLNEFVQLVDGPELVPDSGIFFRADSILGHITEANVFGSGLLLVDGGVGFGDDVQREFVLGQRGSVTSWFGQVLVPSTERLVDGGRPRPDGGVVVFGDAVVMFDTSTFARTGFFQVPFEPTAGGVLGRPDGGGVAVVTVRGDAGAFLVDMSGVTPSRDPLECDTPLLDSLVTFAATDAGVPAHRLVTLAQCMPSRLDVVSWTERGNVRSNRVSINSTNARMAIAPEVTPTRAPVVAWKRDFDGVIFLTRFNAEGTVEVRSRNVGGVVTGMLEVAALTIDVDENVWLVLSTRRVKFDDLPSEVRSNATEVIIAKFDAQFRLLWAGPLAGTSRLAVSDALHHWGRLVLALDCVPPLQAGDFCMADRTTYTVGPVFADGGVP